MYPWEWWWLCRIRISVKCSIILSYIPPPSSSVFGSTVRTICTLCPRTPTRSRTTLFTGANSMIIIGTTFVICRNFPKYRWFWCWSWVLPFLLPPSLRIPHHGFSPFFTRNFSSPVKFTSHKIGVGYIPWLIFWVAKTLIRIFKWTINAFLIPSMCIIIILIDDTFPVVQPSTRPLCVLIPIFSIHRISNISGFHFIFTHAVPRRPRGTEKVPGIN